MNVGCLLISRFTVAVEVARRPELRGRPILVARQRPAEVLEASEAARRAGVLPGQPVREAISRCPVVEVIQERTAFYELLWEEVCTAIEQVAPGVEPAAPGQAFIDLRGLGNCYPSLEAMHRSLLSCADASLQPKLGISHNRWSAHLAAVRAKASQGHINVVDAEGLRELLPQLSLDDLPVSYEMRRRLRLFGINTFAELGKMRRSAVVAQFGLEGGDAWELAKGIDESQVKPRPWRERVVVRLELASPAVTVDALLVATKQLLRSATLKPSFRNKATRNAAIALLTESGLKWQKVVTFKEALSEANPIFQMLKAPISSAKIPGPISQCALELLDLVPAAGMQELLPTASGGREKKLEEGLRKLRTQFGRCPIGHVVEVEPWSRIPERRLALIDWNH
jgi:DNA polymerase-4/protein ImuB